ncbi:hypothetical protein DRO59_07570 [Candidatus Bathyarchaeota archaeon]|nr:MAG: hypothetical protein DRO59_07570 [Candidatus Bathyarchaeota archaeon]
MELKSLIDDLDRKIVRYMCEGGHSYAELAKLCGVSRSTVQRRINELERLRVIKRGMTTFPNFEKLDLSAVIIGMDLNPRDQDKVVSFLKTQHSVKFLWTTFGTHNVVFTILCDKESVGMCIYNVREALEKLGVTPTRFDASVSITWEKTDICP